MFVKRRLFFKELIISIEGQSYEARSGQPPPCPSSWMLHLSESMIKRITSNLDLLLLVLVAKNNNPSAEHPGD